MKRDKPYYSLKTVKRLALSNCCNIRMKARKTAKEDFGWRQEDIKKAITKLKTTHYHKTAAKYDNPSIHVDYYKARNLMGENIYIHFRIENDILFICSFKDINRKD